MQDPRRTARKFRTAVDAGRIGRASGLIGEAIDEALEADAASTAGGLIALAAGPLGRAGRADRALDLLDRVLAALDRASEPLLCGRLLAARSGLLRSVRRYAEAYDDQSEALMLCEAHGTEAMLTTLRHDRAVAAGEIGDRDAAVSGLVAAREAFLGMRDRVGVAAADHNLGFLLHDLGALDDAVEYLTEARDIFLAIDMPEEAAACDQNLGVVFYDAGRLTEAGRRFAVAYHRFAENGATTSAAECEANLSTLLTTMGRSEEAARYRARAERAGVGIPTAPGTSSQTAAVTDVAREPSVQSRSTSGSASA